MVILLCITRILPVNGDEAAAVSLLSWAEDSLEMAYISLLDAERSSGNISMLVALLNTALEYQSEAIRALNRSEHDRVIYLARKVIDISNEISETDVSFKVVAEYYSKIRFRNQLLLSFGIVLFTILLGSIGWRYFKKNYIRKIMILKPEVVFDES